MSTVHLTWWGHSTVSVRHGATHVLTDPLLTGRVAHLQRRGSSAPRGLAPDVVVISHLHHDHLHLPSLRGLPSGTTVLVPVGGGGLLEQLNLRVVEVAAGDCVQVGDVTVRAVVAVHDDRRHPGSSWRAPTLGYVLESRRGGPRTWFAGDTADASHLGADVGRVEVALVPVGGWGPASRSPVRGQHLGPVEAAEVVQRVGASLAVPIHYGTLWPVGLRLPRTFTSPGRQFVDLVPQARLLAPGESTCWTAPGSVSSPAR